MFALGLYLNETPVVYAYSPDTDERDLAALDGLVYSTVGKYSLSEGFLTPRGMVLAFSFDSYKLLMLFDKTSIAGFYKDVARDIRARLVPYEGQNVDDALRPYGVRLVERLSKAYAYLPRRSFEEYRIAYRALVAETGHESFGVCFDEFVVVFGRKGLILGRADVKLEDDNFELESAALIAEAFGMRPRGILVSSGPRNVRGVTIRFL